MGNGDPSAEPRCSLMISNNWRLALGSHGLPFLAYAAKCLVWTASEGHAGVHNSVFIHYMQISISSMSFIGCFLVLYYLFLSTQGLDGMLF